MLNDKKKIKKKWFFYITSMFYKYRSSCPDVFYKNMFLKVLQNSLECACVRVSFWKNKGLQADYKETPTQVFPVSFAKSLRPHIWRNVSRFKDTLKSFDDFKIKQNCIWSNVFWYVKVCIFWKCIKYTIQHKC